MRSIFGAKPTVGLEAKLRTGECCSCNSEHGYEKQGTLGIKVKLGDIVQLTGAGSISGCMVSSSPTILGVQLPRCAHGCVTGQVSVNITKAIAGKFGAKYAADLIDRILKVDVAAAGSFCLPEGKERFKVGFTARVLWWSYSDSKDLL